MAELIALLKSYGPGMAPWVLLFIIIVFIAGKGGRAAMDNVTTLMRESEELRGLMKDSLHNCQEEIKQRDKIIKEHLSDAETARMTMRRMRHELEELEDRVLNLTAQLRRAAYTGTENRNDQR